MFWHLLLLLLSPLSVMVSRLLGDDRDRQPLALRQQVLILQRQLGKRSRLNRTEKLILLLTGAGTKQRKLLDCLLIVKPATLIGWHRQIVRRHWTLRPNPSPAQPFLATRANSRRTGGYRELGMLGAALDEGKRQGKEVTAA